MKRYSHRGALLTLAILINPLSLAGQDDPAEGPQADAPIVLSDGVYSAEQAKMGSQVFDDICLACHDADEFEGIVEGWAGETAYDLFDQLRNTMPEDAPGSLRRKEYVAIVAYMLELNGVPAGEEELGTETELLKRIVLETPELPGNGEGIRR